VKRVASFVAAVVIVAVLFAVFLRAVEPSWVLQNDFVKRWLSTPLGSLVDRYAWKPAADLLASWLNELPDQEALGNFVIGIYSSFIAEFAANSIANTIAGGIFTVIFGSAALFYNWFRVRPIRRLCSFQLLFASAKIVRHYVLIEEKTLANGKTFADASVGEPLKSLTFSVDEVARNALQKLSFELQSLMDFSIAYDYAFRRGTRVYAARTRIYATYAKEITEQILTHATSPLPKVIDLLEDAFLQPIAYKGNFAQADLLELIGWVVDETIELADQLEGRFLWLLPPFARYVPRRMRPSIQHLRRQHERRKKRRVTIPTGQTALSNRRAILELRAFDQRQSQAVLAAA
jgi:hypothetical protein